MRRDANADELVQFEALLEFLRDTRAFDFTAYKRPTLRRRVERRMQMVGVESFPAYQAFLEAHPEEVSHLFSMILINVTAFFRDAPVWTYLQDHVVPAVLDRAGSDGSIRVWSAGCASGEEACSLAMIFAEAMSPDRFRDSMKIYATDVDEEALAQARLATYSARAVECVPASLREKYFEPSNGKFVFHKDLRRSIIYGRHDLLHDAPISRVNLLACRNTLMYLNAEAQAQVLARFDFALVPGGYLVLGRAEMLLHRIPGMTPVDLNRRVFMKGDAVPRRERPLAPLPAVMESGADPGTVAFRLRDLAIEADPTAQIIVDAGRTVAATNERSRTMFGLQLEDTGRPIQDVEISYRPIELRSLLDRALREQQAITVRDIEWTTPSGERLILDIYLAPLVDHGQPLGVKVLFRDVTHYRRLQDDLKRSKQQLETAYEELQSTNEELETTNEELQSTIEELETTNEELQSTNEELETMNEELQATNEELHGLNEELRERGGELNRANGLLEAILRTLDEGVIVVDDELRVQAWNAKAHDLWGLQGSEVSGVNLLHLDIGLPVEQLVQNARGCLTGQAQRQELTLPGLTRRGRRVLMRVTCSAVVLEPEKRRVVVLLMTQVPERAETVRE